MESGKLNKIARVYARNLSRDVYGSETITYSLVCETRCSAINGEASVSVVNDEVVYNYPLSIWLRSYVPVTDYCVIYVDNKYFAVDSVIKNVEQNRLEVKAHSIDQDLVII